MYSRWDPGPRRIAAATTRSLNGTVLLFLALRVIRSRVHWKSWSFYRDTWSAGSAIAEDFPLDAIPEFVFKNPFLELGNSLVVLQRKSIIWQPSSLRLSSVIQEPILADLFGMSQFKITCLFLLFELIFLELQKKNRSLAETRSVLISAITRLPSWCQATNHKQSA